MGNTCAMVAHEQLVAGRRLNARLDGPQAATSAAVARLWAAGNAMLPTGVLRLECWCADAEDARSLSYEEGDHGQ